MPDEWKGTPLFNPVATAAGMLEAKGYRIALAGIEPVGPDETCDSGENRGLAACGLALPSAPGCAAAVICEVPPQPDRETVVVPCRVGKQDVAAWLVESGWARAAAAGSYAELAARR